MVHALSARRPRRGVPGVSRPWRPHHDPHALGVLRPDGRARRSRSQGAGPGAGGEGGGPRAGAHPGGGGTLAGRLSWLVPGGIRCATVFRSRGRRTKLPARTETRMNSSRSMRSSARPAQRSAGRSPVQLELFGSQTVPAAGEALRPALVPFPNAAPRFDLLRRLNRLTGGRLRSLELTDNRRTILSVRSDRVINRAPLELRIHRSFTEAPEEVLAAVATFVESKRGSDRAREALA